MGRANHSKIRLQEQLILILTFTRAILLYPVTFWACTVTDSTSYSNTLCSWRTRLSFWASRKHTVTIYNLVWCL